MTKAKVQAVANRPPSHAPEEAFLEPITSRNIKLDFRVLVERVILAYILLAITVEQYQDIILLRC
jgi:hypothetical protein